VDFIIVHFDGMEAPNMGIFTRSQILDQMHYQNGFSKRVIIKYLSATTGFSQKLSAPPHDFPCTLEDFNSASLVLLHFHEKA
jgi:hypothetical protein